MAQPKALRETKAAGPAIPFDADHLDLLMDSAGIDVLIATSKHNVQYLTGGYRAMFFESMDAIGLSRYLPAFVYRKGAPTAAAYVGHRLETSQIAALPPWVENARAASTTTIDAIEIAADLARAGRPKRIGVERAFLPVDAAEALARACPESTLADATWVLERLRAKK